MTILARSAWVAVGVALLLLLVCGFNSERRAKVDADFIVTAAPVYEPLAVLRGQERFPKGAQLLFVRNSDVAPLVPGFAATADANVSFNGDQVLFAGKKRAGDPWQVWELTLADRSVRQVTNETTDAIRPLYLPSWRMVYSLRTPKGFQLESARIIDSPVFDEIEPGMRAAFPLTYLNANAIADDVLADGRILFQAGFPLGIGSTPEMFLVYADGSGVESYRCDHGVARWGGKQLASGDVVFSHGSSLARFTSPLAHEEHVAAPRGDYSGDLAEMASGEWLLSARPSPNAHYAIERLWPGSAEMKEVLSRSGEDLVGPVIVAPRTRPHRHPSGLHPWDYANLLALDARLSRDSVLKGVPVSVRLETQDRAGNPIALGTAPVQADGSFFVKVPGDKPIRFALLDSSGKILRQEHGWFWSRGGEQRICVGCHTGPERAAENRVPAVLLRTTTPEDLTGSGQHLVAGSH
jgi:Hydrazine synthase alpha subunit middle domain